MLKLRVSFIFFKLSGQKIKKAAIMAAFAVKKIFLLII